MNIETIAKDRRVQIGVSTAVVAAGVAVGYSLFRRHKQMVDALEETNTALQEDRDHLKKTMQQNQDVLEESVVVGEEHFANLRVQAHYGKDIADQAVAHMERLIEELTDDPVALENQAIELVQNMTEYELDQLLDDFEENKMPTDQPEEPRVIELEDPMEEPTSWDAFEHHMNWDWEAELADREGKDVYVVHETEFIEDPIEIDCDTLTWYAKDEVLVDIHDRPVYNPTGTLGADFTKRFGHGTNQADTVYIRNIKLKAQYEVIKDEGSFAEIVLGADPDELVYEADMSNRSIYRIDAADWDGH